MAVSILTTAASYFQTCVVTRRAHVHQRTWGVLFRITVHVNEATTLFIPTISHLAYNVMN